ncbi:three-helix bundle dimerization domain-containing protein [Dactylosporangium sp. CS-033363]|uniref:three-helix bundle dimerization domain-containing protein n=1 Tax=Dactylosporangium sp. CS-033363 TaxID=3239935 RepID=UPI003D90EA3B
MSEHDGVAHLGDIETALQREITIVQERFPDAPAGEVERVVRDTYNELLSEAEVETHVLSLTRHQVVERLVARGYPLHEPVLGEG